jgi:hypothetical protein
MNAVNQGSIRLVWRREATASRSGLVHFAIVIGLAACGIALLSGPFVEPQKGVIDGWIEQHRTFVAVLFLGAIVVIARVVRRFAELHEQINELPRSAHPALSRADVRSLRFRQVL